MRATAGWDRGNEELFVVVETHYGRPIVHGYAYTYRQAMERTEDPDLLGRDVQVHSMYLVERKEQ